MLICHFFSNSKALTDFIYFQFAPPGYRIRQQHTTCIHTHLSDPPLQRLRPIILGQAPQDLASETRILGGVANLLLYKARFLDWFWSDGEGCYSLWVAFVSPNWGSRPWQAPKWSMQELVVLHNINFAVIPSCNSDNEGFPPDADDKNLP